MAKQQALFDRERKRTALDRENVAHDWEDLKRLKDQLLTQIMALQNTQGPPPLSDGPTDMETQDNKHTQS